jgi:hypothetical protein
MHNVALPGPQEDSAGDAHPERSSGPAPEDAHAADHGSDRRRTKLHVLSEDECLAALTQIPRMLLLGLITSRDANAMRSAVHAILQHHQKRQAGGNAPSVDDPRLVAALRANPDLASCLAPLLTDEQIERVLRQAKEGQGDGAN